MRKVLISIISVLLTIFLCFGIVSCSKGNDNTTDLDVVNVYNAYVGSVVADGGEPLDYEEWLLSIKGEKGDSVKVSSVQKIYSFNGVDTYEIRFSDGTITQFTVTNGKDGVDGEGVSVVSVQKISSVDRVDTYEIRFSDGTTTQFTVTNGKDGLDGEGVYVISIIKKGSVGNVDTYEMLFSDGYKYSFNVSNGTCVTISSISKIGTDGLVDTYEIVLSDNTRHTFTVTNGQTPYIGDNGNWWIGEKDTGVLAGATKEEKEITGGLVFTPMTANGKAGMIVTGFDPTIAWSEEVWDMLDTDPAIYASKYGIINIPSFVGDTPVIGVASEVFDCLDYIGKVSFSKNTVWIGNGAFEECTNLTEVDFNGAPLKTIPKNAFASTKLSSITLPETLEEIGAYAFSDTYINKIVLPESVKTLKDYCFDNVPIKEINYENVTYFGSGCLECYYGKYVYLSKDVEYVGSYAFNSTIAYLEHESLPTTWGSNIAGSENIGRFVSVGCKKNDEYIYKNNLTSIEVLQYVGKNTRIVIPSAIDNLPVTKIGYGFASITESFSYILEDLELISDNYLKSLVWLEEIVIPSTVTKIEYGAFYCVNAMIYIPSSVETMWGGVGTYLGDDYFASSYLAFESTTYPTFKNDGFIDSSSSIESTNWLNEEIRHSLGVNWSKVEYDYFTKSYYCLDDKGCSLLAVMDLDSTTLNVVSAYKGYSVHTIKPFAVSALWNLKNVNIQNGIAKIQGKAFISLSLLVVTIPSSVTTINAYGFDGCCSNFYVAHASKPAEWDSYWAGSNTSSKNVTYNYNGADVYTDGTYHYIVKNDNTLELIKYLGSSSTIKIPRSINGKIVTSIAKGFYSYSGTVHVYIPKTVTTISSGAFINSSYRWYIYCEIETRPQGYPTDIIYNTSYVTYYWGEMLSY